MRIEKIKEVVAKHFGVSPFDISKRKQNVEILRPRQVAIYFARKYTTHGLTAISIAFNVLDTKTISLSIRRIESLASKMPALHEKIMLIAKDLEIDNFYLDVSSSNRKRENILCRYCAKSFFPEHQKKHYCSPQCRKRGASDRQRAYNQMRRDGKYISQKDLEEQEKKVIFKKRMKRYHSNDTACDSGFF